MNPDGYTFVVDIPPGAGSVALEVFEPGLCTDANTGDLLYSAEDNFSNGPRINFRVFANDNTELNHADNLASTPVYNNLFGTNDCTGGSGAGGRWYTMYTIPAGSASEGLWYIQSNVRQNTTESGLNSFALRARPVADTQLCSSMLSATCPDLYALDWLSLYRPSFGGALSGQPAEFFLAQIDDGHAGSAVEITMFDPGGGHGQRAVPRPGGQRGRLRVPARQLLGRLDVLQPDDLARNDELGFRQLRRLVGAVPRRHEQPLPGPVDRRDRTTAVHLLLRKPVLVEGALHATHRRVRHRPHDLVRPGRRRPRPPG